MEYAFSGADFSLLSVLEQPQHYDPGPGWASRLGQSVCLMPDADGDGKAEYLVGAPNVLVPGTPNGVTLTYFCETEQLSTVTVQLGSPPNPDVLGLTTHPISGEPTHPILGETMLLLIDHASFAPGALVDLVLVGTAGTNLPLPGGTLLVDPAALLQVRVGTPGFPVGLTVPKLCDLAGLPLVLQGVSLVGPELLATNALLVRLGTQ